MALAAVLSVVHRRHEDTGATFRCWALPPQTLNLAVAVDLVILEHRQFGLLALMLDLLRGGVNLLLSLLSTTTESKDEMERRFLLDVVVGKGAPVFELLAGKDQALLVGWDAFLVWRGMSGL
jgi:hypothetical protein